MFLSGENCCNNSLGHQLQTKANEILIFFCLFNLDTFISISPKEQLTIIGAIKRGEQVGEIKTVVGNNYHHSSKSNW